MKIVKESLEEEYSLLPCSPSYFLCSLFFLFQLKRTWAPFANQINTAHIHTTHAHFPNRSNLFFFFLHLPPPTASPLFFSLILVILEHNNKHTRMNKCQIQYKLTKIIGFFSKNKRKREKEKRKVK